MSISIAVVQLAVTSENARENRDRTLEAIRVAAARDAQIIVLLELIVSGYSFDRGVIEAASEDLNGPTLAAWANEAARLNVVVAGGFCEKANGKLYNSALLVGPSGLLLHYRKLHLFDREKSVFTAGNVGLGVAATPFGRVGLCVCYDLRFLEVMRILALHDAEVIAVPTAWVQGFDKIERDGDGLIAQARGAIVQANLNQVFVACASQCGSANGIHFLGSSIIADPFGCILAGPLDDEAENTAIAPFDRILVQKSQCRPNLIRPRADRRDDVYELKLKPKTIESMK